MNNKQNAPLQETALINFVEQCDYYLSDECYGSLTGKCFNENVNGGRLKIESQTAVIDQYLYPIEFPVPNTGLCWIREGIPCDYFKKLIFTFAPELSEEYRKIESSIQVKETKHCSCGNKVYGKERKCDTCKRKVRRLRNKRNRKP